MTRNALTLLALTGCLAAIGCDGYALRGHVIEGLRSSVSIVDDDDPRLHSLGLADAHVELTLDPDSLRRKRIGSVYTDSNGSFVMPIDELLPGFLQHEVRLVGSAERHNSAVEHFILPGANKRVLIVLAPGRNTYREPVDEIRSAKRAAERYKPKE